MSIVKRILALAGCVGTMQAALASGVPVVDLTQAANFVLQLTQMYKDYQVIVNTYDNAVSQLNVMTGSRGYGQLLHNPYLTDLLPDENRDQMLRVLQNGASALSTGGRSIYVSQGLEALCEMSNPERREECRREGALNAEFQAMIAQTRERNAQVLDEVSGLMREINSTSDPKGIAELQAQIQAKQAAIAISKSNLELQLRQLELMQQAQEKLRNERQHQTSFQRSSRADIERLLR